MSRKQTPKIAVNGEPQVKKDGFISDFRGKNPPLHLLYVKWAVLDLGTIGKAIEMFRASSRNYATGPVLALIKERDKLIHEEAAFADAWDILQGIRTGELPSCTPAENITELDIMESDE